VCTAHARSLQRQMLCESNSRSSAVGEASMAGISGPQGVSETLFVRVSFLRNDRRVTRSADSSPDGKTFLFGGGRAIVEHIKSVAVGGSSACVKACMVHANPGKRE